MKRAAPARSRRQRRPKKALKKNAGAFNATLEKRVLERTEQLATSEARWRTLAENAPEAVVVLDADTGRFITCNENATRLLGLTREQLMDVGPAEVSPLIQADGRLSLEARAQWIGQALDGGTPVFEWMHKHADGRLIPCEVRLVRLPDERRRLIRGSIIDNTDRRRRERIQRATYLISEAAHAADDLESLYAHIHEIISGLLAARNFYIALLDPVSELISFPYFVDEQANGMPEPRKVTTGLTGEVLRTGRPLLITRSMLAKKRRVGNAVIIDGVTALPFVESGRPAASWLGVPLLFHGRALGAMAVQDYFDETAFGEEEKQVLTFVAEQTALAIQRKRAEQALRENEQKFRALFEATSTGVMIHDQTQYLDANPAVVRMFGYEQAADLIGKNPIDTSPAMQPGGQPTAELARAHIEECMTKGSARFDWMARRADGRDLLVDVVLTRIEMGGRQLIQAVVTDIAERKRAEEELLRSLAREKELSQLKTSFVSLVSHEFRTPLGIIASSAEILRDYLAALPESERREHLDSIGRNTRRMANLMEEVLVLGRLDSGKMAFQPGPVDLSVFCHRLTEEILAATQRACPILLTIDPLQTEAQTDERLLRHILSNLLANAVKYSEPGRPVDLSVAQEGADAVFRVRDSGIGIPDSDQPRLFHSFQRGANVGQRAGTGLGLVIVQRCLELHRGTIQLQSKVGQGTTVTVRLPVFVRPSPSPSPDST